MIDKARLIRAGVGPTQAATFAPILRQLLPSWGITNAQREAAFVAQAMHESVGFTAMQENLFYRTADRIAKVFKSRFKSPDEALRFVGRPESLANFVYAGRNGNGAELSGDGWRYRGRGIFQLTGRANYDAAGIALGHPLVERPELAAQPDIAVEIAAWFWSEHGCNQLADRLELEAITGVINGPAKLGLAEREEQFAHALEAFTG